MSRKISAGPSSLLLTVALLGCTPHRVECRVVNEAVEVANVTVAIYGRSFSARDLAPGGSYSFDFSPEADAHYSLEVQFESGREYEQEIGYVTSGLSIVHLIRLGADGATIEVLGTE